MRWPTLQAAIDFALGTRSQVARFTFYGGEPLLEFPLLKRAVEYGDTCRPSGSHISYRLATNGTLLTEEIAEFLAERDVAVQLSFDGIEQAQNLRERSSFALLDRLLDSLRSRHPRFFKSRVEISVTVPPTSVPFLANSVDHLVGKGVQKIHLTPVFTPQPGWTHDGTEMMDEQFDRILRSSLEHLERTGEVPLALFAEPDAPSGSVPATRAMCEIVDGSSWAVDIDGRVYGCTLFAQSYQSFTSPMLRACLPTLYVADIRDPRLLERMQEFQRAVSQIPIFAQKEKKYSSYRACADCAYFESCVICPASIGHIPGNRDPHRVPDYYCAFNYASGKARDRFPTQPSLLERVRGTKYEEERLRWKALAGAAGTSG